MVRVRIRIVVKDGQLYIQYPPEEVLGKRCFEIGKKIRDSLTRFLDLSDEKIEPCCASNIDSRIILRPQQKKREEFGLCG